MRKCRVLRGGSEAIGDVYDRAALRLYSRVWYTDWDFAVYLYLRFRYQVLSSTLSVVA
jgi:hypothetical protein